MLLSYGNYFVFVSGSMILKQKNVHQENLMAITSCLTKQHQVSKPTTTDFQHAAKIASEKMLTWSANPMEIALQSLMSPSAETRSWRKESSVTAEMTTPVPIKSVVFRQVQIPLNPETTSASYNLNSSAAQAKVCKHIRWALSLTFLVSIVAMFFFFHLFFAGQF